MVGSAERMWVKIEMKPKSRRTNHRGATAPKVLRPPPPPSLSLARQMAILATRLPKSARPGYRVPWPSTRIQPREKPKERTLRAKRSTSIIVGEGKAITFIYQREPDESTYLPGPLPAARLQNENKSITAAGIIAMDQGTDQVWVEGPGTLTEFTKRAVSLPPDTPSATPRTAETSTSRTTTTRDHWRTPRNIVGRSESDTVRHC